MQIEKRPSDFKSYIGQVPVKRRLEIEIHASKIEGNQLRHVLLAGPPGLGKTTLAKILAKQFGKELAETTGPAIKNRNALISKIKNMEPGGFLFIDEMHKLCTNTQEYLLVVLEDFQIDEEILVDGKLVLKKTQMEPFTVIGATTRLSNIDHALRERFGIRETLEPYNVGELSEILRRYIEKRGYDARDDQAMVAIAQRARQTPRWALSLADGLISYALYNETRTLTWSLVEEYFCSVQKIDMYGLNETDHRFLKALLDGPLSIKRWAGKVGEKASELEEIYEPYYVRMDLIHADSRGRRASAKLMTLFGVKVTEAALPASVTERSSQAITN